MSTLGNLIERYGSLTREQADWLHVLISDWQVLADLASADLLLWLPVEVNSFVCVAQVRPSSGNTVHYGDAVGTMANPDQSPALQMCMDTRLIHSPSQPRWFGSDAVREENIPVLYQGKVLAVLSKQTNIGTARTPSRLELNYLKAADSLSEMIAAGEFPQTDSPSGPRRGAPRVGDGMIRLNADGMVLYASPNAISCFSRLRVQHNIVGKSLLDVTTAVLPKARNFDESLPVVLSGRAQWRTEVESGSVSLSVRAIPLTQQGKRIGAILLCRDVSELRRNERELLTKDATIREIHHRVKNNLQTVSALLRLQARRVQAPEAKEALNEAMRRVSTIAHVHDTLAHTISEDIEFDDLMDRTLGMAADVASADVQVRTRRIGSFGLIPESYATALALVLTEVVTNAVEHGLAPKGGGTVEIEAKRHGAMLRVLVRDDGVGITAEPDGGLGSTIVKTLVANELLGEITWRQGSNGGTEVEISLELQS